MIIKSRDIARCGLFGASALLLPVLFHMVRLGHVFMPMYLPLMLLPFFVPPAPAAATSFITPLLSGLLTGMPPFFPPIAPFMSFELALMAFAVAEIRLIKPSITPMFVLIPVLLFGRVLYVAMVYFSAKILALPAEFVTGVSILGGWPGIVVMLVVIPNVISLLKEKHYE